MSKTTHPLDVIDWWKGPTAFVLFFTALGAIAVFLTWHWTKSATETSVRAEEMASFEFRLETHILVECSDKSGDEYQACLRDVVESAAENKRNAQDLQAQKTMAYHTRIMGGMAVIGILVGSVSVYLLFRTLTATRQMSDDTRKLTEDTRQIGLAQIRPWMNIIDSSIESIDQDEKAFYFFLRARFKNIGPTPATEVMADMSVFNLREATDLDSFIKAEVTKLTRQMHAADRIRTAVLQERELQTKISCEFTPNPTSKSGRPAKSMRPMALIAISYKDGRELEWKTTVAMYAIHLKKERQPTAIPVDLEKRLGTDVIAASEVKLAWLGMPHVT